MTKIMPKYFNARLCTPTPPKKKKSLQQKLTFSQDKLLASEIGLTFVLPLSFQILHHFKSTSLE